MNDLSPSPLRQKVLPIFLLFTIGGLWGFFFVLIKSGVNGGVHPASYVFWFTLISGGLMIGMSLLRGVKPRVGRQHLGYFFKIGFLRFSAANIFLYAAQGKLPVGVMAVVMAFTPILTYLISLLLRVDPLAWKRAAGIMLGFAGVLLIVLPKTSLPDPSLSIWVLIGFGAPLLHALGYVLLSEKSRPPDTDSMVIGGGTLLAASVMSFFIALAWGEFSILWPPFNDGEMAMMLHATLAAVNFYAIFELIRIAGPTYMSQSSSLAVGFGVLFGWLIFDELHSIWVWGAIGLILAGVTLVNSQQDKKAG